MGWLRELVHFLTRPKPETDAERWAAFLGNIRGELQNAWSLHVATSARPEYPLAYVFERFEPRGITIIGRAFDLIGQEPNPKTTDLLLYFAISGSRTHQQAEIDTLFVSRLDPETLRAAKATLTAPGAPSAA